MDLHRYRLADFELASEFALPLPACPSGLAVGAAAVRPAAIVRRGEAPRLAAPREQRLLLQVASDDYWLEIPGVARYRVHGGCEIVVEAAADAPLASIVAYLCSYALAALCCQRGLLVVHATTLACSGRAVLLIGASGCGKSALGACLAARGARVVSDDLCIIDTAGERAMAHPGIQRFTLWPDCLELLGCASQQAVCPVRGLPKRAVAIGTAATAALPVQLLLLLREAPAQQPQIRCQPLRWLEALATLAAGASLDALLQGMDRAAAHLEQCRRLLIHARALEIARPLSFAELPRVASLIEQLAAEEAGRALPAAARYVS